MSFFEFKNKIISFKLAIILLSLLPSQSFSEQNRQRTPSLYSNKESLNLGNLTNNNYIIGPGDSLYIDFEGIMQFSDLYAVSPTGEISLPEVQDLYVEGLSVNGLINKLKNEYNEIIKSPSFSIQVINYRPITVNLVGEVRSPGKYTLSGPNKLNFLKNEPKDLSYSYLSEDKKVSSKLNELRKKEQQAGFPDLFNAIRASGGITQYSNLKNIEVMRRRSTDSGGGYVKATVNILPEISGENPTLSQNIKIMDGDIIKISRSKNLITEQMIMSIRNNINPSEIIVFMNGQINKPGKQIIPNGISLNQAIASSGGRKIFSGNVEFIRFNTDGTSLQRKFQYKANAKQGEYNTPMLMNGDIINIARSPIGYATEAISTITKPALGIFTLFNIVEEVSDDD